MGISLFSLEVSFEQDVVLARRAAHRIAMQLGFDPQDQTRIATSVSEIARNAFQHAGKGQVEFSLSGRTEPQLLEIRIVDAGPGLKQPDDLIREPGAMGITGARRLMDNFHIESAPGSGTVVHMTKILPRRSGLIGAAQVARIRRVIQAGELENPFEEIRRQNQELMRALEELRSRQDELKRLNQELEDTNRGVVALYAELDEKADHLRRADEMKSRFLSNMTHEFRTPLNSILSLSRLLKDHVDGELSQEQDKQVTYIQLAAQNLYELVNDMLDLAKIQAGKTEVRPSSFQVSNLFSALRGMLKPLLVNQSVALVFEDASVIPDMNTDEAKVSQIMRNLLSNALKFTERGEIRVSAMLMPERNSVLFSVADTGIGIPAEDVHRIFQEFTQLDHPLQRRVKGTGLGLPLSRRLAELLGGEITVESEPGKGSVFSVRVPIQYEKPVEAPPVQLTKAWKPDPLRTPVLVVEDNADTVLLYQKLLRGSGYQLIPARTLKEAREGLAKQPSVIVLDILLQGEDTWSFLAEVKGDAATHDIPVLVVTEVDDRDKGFSLGADAYCVKPLERKWLLSELRARTRSEAVLVIDDDEMSRYLVAQSLRDTRFSVIQAENGTSGLQRARTEKPWAIFLDLVMPDLNGEAVLAELKGNPETAGIPVIVLTSKLLSDDERRELAAHADALLSKSELSSEATREIFSGLLLGENSRWRSQAAESSPPGRRRT